MTSLPHVAFDVSRGETQKRCSSQNLCPSAFKPDWASRHFLGSNCKKPSTNRPDGVAAHGFARSPLVREKCLTDRSQYSSHSISTGAYL